MKKPRFIESFHRRKQDKENVAIQNDTQAEVAPLAEENKQAVSIEPPRKSEIKLIEITRANVNECIGLLDIVAFKWAAPGACGEGAGVYFITSDGKVYHANHLYGENHIPIDDVYRIFPPLKYCHDGTSGNGSFPPEWEYMYLGLGNYLVVHERISEKFEETAEAELTRRRNDDKGIILYDIWASAVLMVLNSWNPEE